MTTNIFLEQPRRGKTREALITPHKRNAVWGQTDKAEPQCGGRAPRNRTLTVSAGEIPALEPMVSAVGDLRAGFRDDMLVNGDLLECLDLIPDGFFDLILLDPPYNLDKDFHGRKFSSMQSDDYEGFLRSWCSSCGFLPRAALVRRVAKPPSHLPTTITPPATTITGRRFSRTRY